MIRVLQVFGRMDRGGAEAMIMDVYRRIDRSKIQFDFIVHTDDKCAYDEEITSLGGRIFTVPRFSVKNALRYVKAWKSLLSEHEEWNIVHGHVRSTASIYLSIAHKMGRYTISHSHSTSSGKGFSSLIKNILQRKIKADFYLGCSKEAGEWLFGEKIVSSNLFQVFPNAIDTAIFKYDESVRHDIRRDLGCSDYVIVGHIGRFVDPKNHLFLLEVFHSLLKSSNRFKLMLVGDGPLKAQIVEKAEELGVLDNIIFTGVRSDVNHLIQAMDVFVFPSKYEGLGIAVVEAQASGLPTIISDTVPKEAVFSEELVTVQNLNSSPEEWAGHILSRASEKRLDRTEEIIKRGYDISTTSKWIEEFYLERNRKWK